MNAGEATGARAISTATAGPMTEDWGEIGFRDACLRQEKQVGERVAGRVPDTLIFAEHPPVFSIGVRRGARQHLLWDDAKCQLLGLEVVETNRGGDVTYHGPGQIVGYPVVHIGHLSDLHSYLRLLEATVIGAAAEISVPAGRREGLTGIWVEDRKLAAIGIGVRRRVAFHGFAINVNNTLEPFAGIVPCGLPGSKVTSLERELGQKIDIERVKTILTVEFWRLFSETFPND